VFSVGAWPPSASGTRYRSAGSARGGSPPSSRIDPDTVRLLKDRLLRLAVPIEMDGLEEMEEPTRP